MSDDELLMDQDDEKQPHPVVYDQPLHQPRPVAMSDSDLTPAYSAMARRASEGALAAPKRRRFWSTSSSRRPQISAPSNFRHISTASPQFPEPTPSRSSQLRPARHLPHRRGFRPLELSIYMPENRVSPILPHFDSPSLLPRPEPTYAPEGLDLESGTMRPLEHQRSYSSSMSFHLPRKQLDSSPSTIHEEIPAPLIPGKSRLRARAYTSPDVDQMKERVASAMIEVERLQKQIDEVIERQSVYSASRPSTPHSIARTMPDLEPMPSVPALPPAAPSFAERLNAGIDRPHTAPINRPARAAVAVQIPGDQSSMTSSMDVAPSPTPTPLPQARKHDRSPPPPLPLVLRPPLRKKKSFSRVSSWLFPEPEHSRNISLDSVTNIPRPVKGGEGYYQCVSLGETRGARQSVDSVGSSSTWESDDGDRTVPSTWSPGSTPAKKRDEASILRPSALGKSVSRPGGSSVGLAY